MKVFHQKRGWELQELLPNATCDAGTSTKEGVAAEIYIERAGDVVIVELTDAEMRMLSRIPGDWRKA